MPVLVQSRQNTDLVHSNSEPSIFEVNVADNNNVANAELQVTRISFYAEYTLHYKTDDGNWQHERLSSDAEQHTLRNLRCGTRYHLYMTASNSLGTGEPSEAVPARTKGAGTFFLVSLLKSLSKVGRNILRTDPRVFSCFE
ncbi:hypothetical protein AVEN_222305-1 [Araneus ventricosus]|uniref:Fibronectin type-III domain-containing protein n=1 Tax=Araneus ventricosus TaxID=182803 RepID=A0A4Y2EUI4_ARAVE|nr:hypothetical protein AVEN_222305-1 [Araneus ventricosus]